VRRERLAGLTVGQKQRFLPLCPDFVIELRSPSDPLPPIQAKMREYVENGARLGWLIDPVSKQVGVYQPEEDVRILEHQRELSGDPVLRGFVLDLQPIWEPGF
jgi:Uma2 family endonuclease